MSEQLINISGTLPAGANLTLTPEEDPETRTAKIERENIKIKHDQQIEIIKLVSGLSFLGLVIVSILIVSIFMWVNHPTDAVTVKLCETLFISIISGSLGFLAGGGISKPSK
jgi:hypothetical protein